MQECYISSMKLTDIRSLLLLLIVLAAGVVLAGAFGKIRHWHTGADEMLIAGMMMEVLCAAGLVILYWAANRTGKQRR
jgi:hypothetical protein